MDSLAASSYTYALSALTIGPNSLGSNPAMTRTK